MEAKEAETDCEVGADSETAKSDMIRAVDTGVDSAKPENIKDMIKTSDYNYENDPLFTTQLSKRETSENMVKTDRPKMHNISPNLESQPQMDKTRN